MPSLVAEWSLVRASGEGRVLVPPSASWPGQGSPEPCPCRAAPPLAAGKGSSSSTFWLLLCQIKLHKVFKNLKTPFPPFLLYLDFSF